MLSKDCIIPWRCLDGRVELRVEEVSLDGDSTEALEDSSSISAFDLEDLAFLAARLRFAEEDFVSPRDPRVGVELDRLVSNPVSPSVSDMFVTSPFDLSTPSFQFRTEKSFPEFSSGSVPSERLLTS